MTNLKQLEKRMEHGDYTRIMEMFNRRHKKIDGKRISLPYVYLILKGKRRVAAGSMAEEIVEITERYLAIKQRTREELMIMT